MSLDGDIALLKRVPLFGELPTEQLRLIAFSAVRLDLVAGQVLFREGAKAACGYVVSGGKLELTMDEGKKPKVVATAETRRAGRRGGALRGDAAAGHRHGVRSPARWIEIDRKLITRMLNEYPYIAIRMRATLADRLTATVFELGRVRQALARIDRIQPRRTS